MKGLSYQELDKKIVDDEIYHATFDECANINEASYVGKTIELAPMADSSIKFYCNTGVAMLELHENGDTLVKEKLVENDGEVVDAFREFLIFQGFLRQRV
jgi:hypothetical protein